ncbi:adenosylmethionine--8-amino-7-oxononanoate transaminase [Luteolibacter yonseiensis]|uniref:Adenosylmethionine-8-amino-7-oxononanoate aminotransferase n=1 Tax=Luteolibacter yonseiensis TaxID=1144680 RepID=A0A934R687_9BACT|nr:adenosylmethionine--8-amino-7-oxononanoate transaminase [Luteolibacter yonseiensis]MBK1816010.1 adenosylmethionine--8-amino-7-oxononanoate transaminase [Luteolibacter yonseiensis]
MREDTRRWIEQDQARCWHPFTRQAEWCARGHEPLVITRGEGSWLWDSEGRKYLDGNSSIWTNIHGHAHPAINAAILEQLGKISHSSFLGFTHPLAAELATRLCAFFPENTLERVFFSDDGSTAVECALKMAVQYRMQTGAPDRNQFVAFSNGYHGDTLGAASLGGVGRFFERFRNTGYRVRHVATLDELRALSPEEIAGVVIEPLIQGVNEMRPWRGGMLAELREWCDETGVHLILDEVMTGFGRTGRMFACQHEEVIPDFLCLAKGLTGGYLPMAATLTTGKIYDAFLGDAEKAFYYGHSYTANPLGCAAALASLDVFETEKTLARLPEKISRLSSRLATLKSRHPVIHEIRQCGFIAGIELRRPDGEKFPLGERFGEAICQAARAHGLLTRPILDTIVLMPPLRTSLEEIDSAIAALDSSLP